MAKKKSDEDVKSEIIKAARSLFMKYGYNKTTMEDIAKAAGKGKSTLYYYYPSKDDVMFEVLQSEVDALFKVLKERLVLFHTAKEKFQNYFIIGNEFVEKTANLYQIMHSELIDNYPIQKKLRAIYDDRDIQYIKSILVFGIENNEFTRINPNDLDDLATIISATNQTLIFTLFIEQEYENWKKHTNLLFNVVMQGMI